MCVGHYTIIHLIAMKKFKQTLAKPQSNKKVKKNATFASFAKKNKQHSQLQTLIECKSTERFQKDPALNAAIVSIIQSGQQSQQSIDQTLDRLLTKCQISVHQDSGDSPQKNKRRRELEQCLQIVEDLISEQKGNKTQELLRNFYSDLQEYAQKCKKVSKAENLEDYDKLVRLLSPRHFKHKPKDTTNKLLKNKSGGNLNIKVTREEYEIKRQKDTNGGNKQKQSSQKQRLKSIGSNRSSNDKLKNFLKDNSYKIIKTKVEYDYSAILEASKSKIRQRKTNKTSMGQSKKVESSKINKVKKDDGFIFYRPTKGGNESMVYGKIEKSRQQH